jgi:hypothetical protein
VELDYNGQMNAEVHKVRVIESRPRDHVRNLSVEEGDVIGVGHRNQQYPEMHWCTHEGGLSGWMAESYFEYSSLTEAVVTTAYDAAQLTVLEGEDLGVVDMVGDWWLCRNERGIQGWVPRRILEDLMSGDS